MAFTPDDIQKGVVGLLLTFIAGLFGWRSFSRVRADNAKEQRESRFEEQLQRRYEAAMARNSELQDLLEKARDGKAQLEQRVRDQSVRLKTLLEMLGENERREAERWIRESEFAPFDPAPQKRKGL